MQENKIYCEDCLETMSRMEDGYLDLTITSPPYDDIRHYKDDVGKRWSFDKFTKIAKELYRVTKDGGVVVWVINDKTENYSESGTSFRHALYFKDEVGFCLNDTMIWKKDMIPQNNGARYEPKFEYMFVFSKGKPKTFNPIKKRSIYNTNKVTSIPRHRNEDDSLDRRKKYRPNKDVIIGNIWDIPVGGLGLSANDKIAYQHPAIFPERLVEMHVISWTNKGDLVYDPFIGSGTVAKMCIELDRRWIGSEISKEYVDLANKRIKPYLMQGKLNF